jgi:heme/copper-type cytochrome/quinol oxidase subunit 1
VQPSHIPKFLLVGGIALIVVGGAVLAFVPTNQFGWFAYAPLSESVTPGVVLGTAHLWGAAACAVGLVVSGWAAGYLAGRRTQRHA